MYHFLIFSTFLFFFPNTGGGTQGFTLARQALNYLPQSLVFLRLNLTR
jgi:hypothetical protein